MSSPCCKTQLIPKRCTDVSVVTILVGDENGATIVDDFNTALAMGIDRTGQTQEFEYNRQETV